jgi:sodium pump decarboxylase gamma subunit
MNFLLEMDGNLLAFGGEVVLVGIGTVFAVLGIIWACLTLFRVVFYDIPNKRANADKEEVKPVVETAAVNVAPDNDDEIIAVIAAAIAAAESENTGLKFKVVSFRRV